MNEQEVLDAQIGCCPDTESMFDQEPEPILADLDNDGTFESVLQGFDTDNDDQVDTWGIASDIDGDGIADQASVLQGIDTDGDGLADVWGIQTDLNNDGIPNEVALTEINEVAGAGDTFSNDFGSAGEVIGNPEADMQHWEWQGNDMTCAIKSQEFILDQLGGRDFSKEELVEMSIQEGWYTPSEGTKWDCVGNLLEANGIPVERVNHQDSRVAWEDLQQKLDKGEKVIVGVDADEIWNSNGNDEDDQLTNAWGLPGGGADHAVQVIGIENPNSDNPIVILNDSGNPEGRGLKVPASLFIDAWQDSGQYMVSTVNAPALAIA